MCIAKSGQGKENIKTFVESVLGESLHDKLVVGDGYTSSGAVHSVLKMRPTQITIMDEFGKRLENISQSSNSNREDGIQTLMESWGQMPRYIKTRQLFAYERARRIQRKGYEQSHL